MSKDGQQRRILVVEDEPEILRMMKEVLENDGYKVEVSGSVVEAYQKLGAFMPHLILTDQDMPSATGIELLRSLRNQLNYVAVIFVSGRTDSHLVSQALKAGADDYIRKPFRFDELLARVESCLRTHDLHYDLMEANQKLQDMIERDYLTGLFNMRSMYDRIEGELKRAARFARQVCCVMIDMDHFKIVNDSHDHLFGSFVLKEAGDIIRKTIRDSDFAARYGGDEFLIVLTDTDSKGAATLCERLRSKFEKHIFTDGTEQVKLTISIGCAVSDQHSMSDARSLVRAADHALYRAKELGRNRFELAWLSSSPP